MGFFLRSYHLNNLYHIYRHSSLEDLSELHFNNQSMLPYKKYHFRSVNHHIQSYISKCMFEFSYLDHFSTLLLFHHFDKASYQVHLYMVLRSYRLVVCFSHIITRKSFQGIYRHNQDSFQRLHHYFNIIRLWFVHSLSHSHLDTSNHLLFHFLSKYLKSLDCLIEPADNYGILS